MITSRQLRAARALAGLDQRALAKASRLSLPTIQRMEASDGVVRGNVESLMKLIAALERAGHRADQRGRGKRAAAAAAVRLKRATEEIAAMALEGLLWCIAALLGTGVAALALARHRVGDRAGLRRFALAPACIALVIAGCVASRPRLLGGKR